MTCKKKKKDEEGRRGSGLWTSNSITTASMEFNKLRFIFNMW